MTLTNAKGKDVELPPYVMKCLDQFGNTVISEKLFKKFKDRDDLIRAFREWNIDVWVRRSKLSDHCIIVEML